MLNTQASRYLGSLPQMNGRSENKRDLLYSLKCLFLNIGEWWSKSLTLLEPLLKVYPAIDWDLLMILKHREGYHLE
jgi:hypothetical protein